MFICRLTYMYVMCRIEIRDVLDWYTCWVGLGRRYLLTPRRILNQFSVIARISFLLLHRKLRQRFCSNKTKSYSLADVFFYKMKSMLIKSQIFFVQTFQFSMSDANLWYLLTPHHETLSIDLYWSWQQDNLRGMDYNISS